MVYICCTLYWLLWSVFEDPWKLHTCMCMWHTHQTLRQWSDAVSVGYSASRAVGQIVRSNSRPVGSLQTLVSKKQYIANSRLFTTCWLGQVTVVLLATLCQLRREDHLITLAQGRGWAGRSKGMPLVIPPMVAWCVGAEERRKHQQVRETWWQSAPWGQWTPVA